MIGGMASSTLLTLIVIPVIYDLVKGWGLPRESAADPRQAKSSDLRLHGGRTAAE
ncbi:hypothetical protein SAMN06265338_1225 [Rhodoblastus acidophilus]|uniref:AcrB/AcrD/AcrF family protein n=1 Tax=Rhodoblastus acidophilus TaxID=1074 RepID=A0A212SAZ7_RHOAC|nr:hypothetical protein SAMN06265338_1225 [Rhodoblastus acidophilus]